MARRILIVDDVPTNRIILKVKLTAACYEASMASGGAEAVAMAQRDLPDLILLDYAMPEMDGIAVCRALRADPATARIPVIMFTNSGDDTSRIAALRAGADDFLTKPIDDKVLMARIRNLMRARDTTGFPVADGIDGLGFAEPTAGFDVPQPGCIALLAPRPETALRWRKALAQHLPDRLVVMTREAALEGGDHPPDLYILAADLEPGVSGMQMMSDLRSRPESCHAAICLVLPTDAHAEAATALDLGADDVLREDFDGAEAAVRAQTLIARKREGDRQRARLAESLRLSVTDPLTGLHNRRYALPVLGRLITAAARTRRPCAVMVLDLDRFKTVNDHYGHAAGDSVLVEVANRLSATLRLGDLIARLGGEEFLVAIPDVPEPEARDRAERLRRAISDRPVTLPCGGRLGMTVSIGLALSSSALETADMVIGRADRALLAAKAEGRNQVTMGGRTAA
ncbi:diguanylate cyclase [Gemmobacter sp.]|uniref:diguanylate cyclase n=1 Tax=Gemmobacter sp. TaxID=1898957 RepID=UPI002AFEC54E|nr:diguanylate cyclase [Gemmobacter sp.]